MLTNPEAELSRLTPDFMKRGFTSGKVEFAVEFDRIYQNAMESTIIQEIKETIDNPEETEPSDLE